MTKLIAFIAAHGQHAIEQDGQLMAVDHRYSAAEGSTFEWIRLEPTIRAVREWLGY